MVDLKFPMLGLGTVGREGERGIDLLLEGVEIGFRHLDTAQSYNTEVEVGQVVRRSALPRSELFVTSKVAVANLGKDTFIPSVKASLERLRLDYVDELLIHWPSPHDQFPFAGYVTALAEAKQLGMAKRIGLSNFPIARIEQAEALVGKGAFSTNQVEVHPYLANTKLHAYCAAAGIQLVAFIPLARGKVVNDPVLTAIGESHGASSSQVALAWLLQRGIAAIPASGSRKHMEENLASSRIVLSEAEMARIAGQDAGARIVDRDGGPDWD
jgi:2,5-diketo-D-gluconate reductase B